MKFSSFETPKAVKEFNFESYRSKLVGLVSQISQQINSSLECYKNSPKAKNLVMPDGSIDMRSFMKVEGGPYDKSGSLEKASGKGKITSIKEDEALIRKLERKFSGANDDRIRNFFKKNNRLDLDGDALTDKMVEAWKSKREKEKGILLEMAVNSIFHKFLGDEFVVVRAAAYDDYNQDSGVDNLIVSRITGDVVCTFDEVHDVSEDKEKRVREKMEKVIKMAQKGGAEIKYGFTFEDDRDTGEKRLIKRNIENVPKFYLSLSTEELKELLAGMEYDLNSDPSEAESRAFDKLVEALESQTNFLKTKKINDKVSMNLDKFSQSLARMKELKGLKQPR